MPDEIETDLDWQWNVSSWSKQDSPSTALAHYLLAKPGDVAMLDIAFAWLQYGQRHDERALARYADHRARHGDDGLYLTVVRSAGARRPDRAEAAVHVEWQLFSDPLSVTGVLAASGAGRSARDAVTAMYHLMRGQWHNANACQLFRACFAADPDGFLAAVARQARQYPATAGSHPYLLGHEPSPTSIRDEVPRRPSRG